MIDPRDRPRPAAGTAVGDALGLACEGLDAATIARRFGDLDRYRLVGRFAATSPTTPSRPPWWPRA
ncbi:MAG: ADP-ribosylglycohydrolase family protein [bacterium]